MELRSQIAPMLIWPTALRQRVFNEQWQKGKIDVSIRTVEEALCVKMRPLPSLEILFKVTNHLPVPLQIFSASVELWLGKPVVQFQSYISESLRPDETRETFRVYHFLNPYQLELLNPPKKDSLPPNVTLDITVSGRSTLGVIEKSIRTAWVAPKVI